MNTDLLKEEFRDILLDILQPELSDKRKSEIDDWINTNFSNISSEVPFEAEELLAQMRNGGLAQDFVSKAEVFLSVDSDDEQIELYLRNLMSEEEAEQFKSRLKSDKILREKAKARVALIKVIREVGADQDGDLIDDVYDNEVERYLRNQMSKKESDSFKELLRTNKVLREKAKARAALIKVIKEVGMERDREVEDSVIKLPEPNTDGTHETPVASKVIPLWTKIASVAAVVLLFVSLGGRMYSSHELDAYVDSNFKEITYGGVSRGGDATCDSILSEISRDIRAGMNLSDHIKWLDEDSLHCYQSNQYDLSTLKYFAYLKSGNRKEAENVLDNLIDEVDEGSKLYEWAKKEKENLNKECSFVTKIF